MAQIASGYLHVMTKHFRSEEARRAVVDPHGASEPVTSEEYIGRRGGLRGAWDTLAYWVQFAGLWVYGAADQPRASDPIERLKRKYGRPGRKF